MALTYDFLEEYRSSRVISLSKDSFTQDFVFFLYGNFYDEAADDATYGPDDDLLALETAYSIIPSIRTMPLYEGGYIILTLTDLKMEQIDNDTWKISVSYGTPNDDSGGDQNPALGPANGEATQWTENFVQLSFNVTANTQRSTQSILVLDSETALGSGVDSPFPLGQKAPVGLTVDSVEGYEHYVRGFAFSITAFFRPGELTFRYTRRLYRMATTINDRIFFGFPEGSVLFKEASAAGDLYSIIPVTFDFEMRPNFAYTSLAGNDSLMDPDNDDPDDMYDLYSDPDFPDAINSYRADGIFDGWSLVDYGYTAQIATDAKTIGQKPWLRTIHKIYHSSNFDSFNL